MLPSWVEAVFGPFGLLPVAAPLAAVLAWELGVRAAPTAGRADRVIAGGVLAVAALTGLVRLLGWLGLVSTWSLLGPLGAAAIGLRLGRKGRAPLGLRDLVDGAGLPGLAVAAAAVLAAAAAAYYLPVWHWDSIGYHLPFVNFVLQDGSLHGVPKHQAYLATYPHNVEYLFLALRLVLPDDRLIDLGQLPVALLGAAATAGLARRAGARVPDAVLAGALWLTLPAVFLQLPSNYVDVASVSLLLAAIYWMVQPASARTVLLAGVALGLFLGAKPSAPVPAALLGAVLVVRALRAGLRAPAVAACALVLVFGAESYVLNTFWHGNPIWPVRVRLGPIALPGIHDMKTLLSSGAAAPHLTGNIVARTLGSWLTLDPVPAFDMRVGGFGPLFLVALPLMLLRFVRRRAWLWLACALATFASPDPAVARYTLGLPAIAFAATAPLWAERTRRVRGALGLLVAFVAVWNLKVAWPGLTGEGPPLASYVNMSWDERARAVGPDEQTGAFIDARQKLGPGELAAFDGSFELLYHLWRTDLKNRVVRLPDPATVEETRRAIDASRVRLLVAGDREPSAEVARAGGFTRLFKCRTDACTVYLRR